MLDPRIPPLLLSCFLQPNILLNLSIDFSFSVRVRFFLIHFVHLIVLLVFLFFRAFLALFFSFLDFLDFSDLLDFVFSGDGFKVGSSVILSFVGRAFVDYLAQLGESLDDWMLVEIRGR